MLRRRYITQEELNIVIKSIQQDTNNIRDACMIYMSFLHGFRASELTGLTLSDIDLLSGKINVHRLKKGRSTIHPIISDEMEMLKSWLIKRNEYIGHDLPWLFLSRKGGRMSRQRFYNIVRNYGVVANLPTILHPHMLRHACGFSLADRRIDTRLIQDYLGHKNIRHTVIYTASNSERFYNIWCNNPQR
ncbi:tyrosine-type DNA invertase [Serratia fonticola]|uniref:tyrosine-type DNA invertase n=1 Tax=Serratia fonticola TaxID=47917 RepID=UPI00301DCBA9